MDYILYTIDFKLKMFKNKNEKLSLINLYRSKFLYIITLYLAISYNKNPDSFNKEKAEILKALKHPSEGTLLEIIQHLQKDLLSISDTKNKRGISVILQEYVKIRNRDFGHDYSCDPQDHSNLIAKFENLAKEIDNHRYPYITNDLYIIAVNMVNGDSYEGICFNPNGSKTFWEQNTSEKLSLNELYIATNPNDPKNFIRVSPFIIFDCIADDIYLFRQIDNEKSGIASYIKLFQQNPNGYIQTWEELSQRERGNTSPSMKDIITQEAMMADDLSKEDKDILQAQFKELFSIKSGLLVIGDYGSGKSSIINSIFNTDVAKVGVIPGQRRGITEYEIDNLTVWEANIDQTDDLETLFAENTIDVILFASNALTAFTQGEVQFVTSFLLPKLGNLDKVIFALTHSDAVPREDYQFITQNAKSIAMDFFKNKITLVPYLESRPLFPLEIRGGSIKIIMDILTKIPAEKRPAYEGAFKAIADNEKDNKTIQSYIWKSALRTNRCGDTLWNSALKKFLDNE